LPGGAKENHEINGVLAEILIEQLPDTIPEYYL
jgi:hypothetical protein